MSAQKIVLTKRLLSGNATIRADVADTAAALGSGSWVNVTLRGLEGSAAYAREKADQYAAIADELDKLVASGGAEPW
ncbi:hypothetical protein [Rhodococcoides fascians]|uniref:hypothetical protein n=1 Tax=Rhodococcoides fascians TaxID=1828 RepID=UPI00050C0F3F|nr:hypothetical protein [Rhodococcus fascians]